MLEAARLLGGGGPAASMTHVEFVASKTVVGGTGEAGQHATAATTGPAGPKCSRETIARCWKPSRPPTS